MDMKEKQSMMDKRALDVLTDKYESFQIENEKGETVTLHLYPLQLGRLAMISRRLLDLDVAFSDDAENEVRKMWKICSEKPREVAEIIAIATLRTKQEIDEGLNARTELILNSPSMLPLAMSNVLAEVIYQSFYWDFINAIRSVKMLQVEVSQKTEAERIAITEYRPSGDR